MEGARVAANAVRGVETVALRLVRPDRREVRAAASALSTAATQGRVWVALTAVAAAHPRLRAAGRRAPVAGPVVVPDTD